MSFPTINEEAKREGDVNQPEPKRPLVEDKDATNGQQVEPDRSEPKARTASLKEDAEFAECPDFAGA